MLCDFPLYYHTHALFFLSSHFLMDGLPLLKESFFLNGMSQAALVEMLANDILGEVIDANAAELEGIVSECANAVLLKL